MAVFQKGKHRYVDYYDKGRRKRKKIGRSGKLAGQVLGDVETGTVKKEYPGIIEEKRVLFEDSVEDHPKYARANEAGSGECRDEFGTSKLQAVFEGRCLSDITTPRKTDHGSFR